MQKKLEKTLKLLFILFLGYPLYFLSFLFPRKKKRWIFGSGNSFSDNAKYLFLDVIENHKDIDAAWLSKNKDIVEELQQKNLPAYYIYSSKGIKHLATSSVYVLSHYPGVALPLWCMGGAKYVQLWHGIGIKNLVYKRDDAITLSRFKHGLLKYLFRPIVYPMIKTPSLYLSTSKAMTDHFQECYRFPKEVFIESFYPRCLILDWLYVKAESHIETNENDALKAFKRDLDKYQKVYIYMPTWREGKPLSVFEAGFNLIKLNNFLSKNNFLFIFKLHFLTPKTFTKQASSFSHIIILDNELDIYPLLSKTDVLITDYSSIYYDYLLMPEKHTIFFDYDRDEYINERDFAFDYDEHTNGLKVKTFEELLKALKTESYLQVDKNKDHQLREFFWGLPEEKVDLIQEIKKLELK